MDTNRRVKVYKMTDGTWQDIGTGDVECIMLTDDTPGIVVKTDTDRSVFLQSRIPPGNETFLKQQVRTCFLKFEDTLIVWNEVDEKGEMLDLALSFQEETGCSKFWTQIQEIQQSLNSAQELFSLFPKTTSDLFLESSPKEENMFELPPANLGNLDAWVKLLESSMGTLKKQVLGETIFAQNYVPQIVDLFRIARDFENKDDLVKMFHIFKYLFLLGNRGVIEGLVDPGVVFDVMEALEHDPTVRAGLKVCHSKFLREQVVFKEVFPFTHPKILPKVHQSYYLQYAKDVALLPSLDDATNSMLASMIYVNNVQVLTHLTGDGPWLASIFQKIQTTTSANELRDQLGFLAEFVELSQQLELTNKFMFYRTLVTSGLFEMVQQTLPFPDTQVRLLSVMVAANNLRAYIIGTRYSTDESPMLQLLVSSLNEEPDYGIKNLLTEVLRILLIDESNDNTEELQEFLNIFYIDYARSFFASLFEPPDNPHSEASGLLKNHLCDFISIFLDHHGNIIKFFIIDNDIMTAIFKTLLKSEKFLALAALRVLKKLVSTQDSSLLNYIINKDLLTPVVDIFLEHGDKYTIFNSAILELFYIIGAKNIKPLLNHYITNFHEKLKDIQYVQTFQNLKLIHERNVKEENMPKEDLLRTDTQEIVYDQLRERHRQRYREEHDEEAWFESEDDNEEDNMPLRTRIEKNTALSEDWLPKRRDGDTGEIKMGIFRATGFSKKRKREETEEKEVQADVAGDEKYALVYVGGR